MTTLSTQFINGIPCTVPNVTSETKKDSFNLWGMRFDRFYISYNNYDIDIYGSDTSAIVLEGTHTAFFILNGNHKKNLEELKTIKECFTYFVKNQKYHNKMTDTKKRLKELYKMMQSV